MQPSLRKAISALLATMLVVGSVGLATAQEEVLTLIYWQAPSTMNNYLSGGTKETEAASVVLEPLVRYDETGNFVPWLVEEVPTLENGGVSEDLTQITYNIAEGILWSDGTPFSASDVVFTWEYCTTPETGCAQLDRFEGVVSVEAVDALTVTITFDEPKPFPYTAFVGAESVVLQQAQFADCVGAAAAGCTDQNFMPIGTGAYMVEEFRANDVISFVPNPNYREEGKPFFDRVILQGGGDAESAARAVLATGEADYAWNLQVDPGVLAELEAQGNGQLVTAFGTSVERIVVNQTNPRPEAGDARSLYMDGENPHPFLTDPAVYQALSIAIDRQVLVDRGYGAAGRPTCDVLPLLEPPPAYYASPGNTDCLEQDIEGANALLDEAGYIDTDGDGVRETPDGMPLSVLYTTSVNAVRQDTQRAVQQWWSQIGVETELNSIDASVFFGGDPASTDTYQRFYSDVEMYTSSASGPDVESYMAGVLCSNMPGPENNWLGTNVPRYCDPAYDALHAELQATADEERRAEIVVELNNLVVSSGAWIPLIHRGDVSAASNSIEGVLMNSWDSELWNIADWTRVSG